MGLFETLKVNVLKQKYQPVSSQGAAAKYWDEQARELNRMTASYTTQCRELEDGLTLMRNAAQSRMYWHDKRSTAHDLLTDHAKLHSPSCFPWSESARVLYRSKTEPEGVEGWFPVMDNAADRHRKVIDKLVGQMNELEELLSNMLAFREERTGWRAQMRKRIPKLKLSAFRMASLSPSPSA